MGDDLDTVFVSLNPDIDYKMNVLEWALDHFNNDETKIILTFFNAFDVYLKNEFMQSANEQYLLRCRDKKFRAEILLPNEASNVKSSISELINGYGMRKLVYLNHAWDKWGLSIWFDQNPHLTCKTWLVGGNNGELISIRDTCLYPGKSVTRMQMDALLQNEKEHHKVKQSTIYQRLEEERDNLKEELHKIQNKEIDTAREIRQLRLENQQLKDEQNAAAKEKKQLQLDNQQLIEQKAQLEMKKLRMGRNCIDFTLQELEHATQNFSASLELGKGAFGCVYKGYIHETNVAVKKLNSQTTESISGFNKEVAILSTIRHPNIVTLFGACHDASALVFEFLPNGSLESHLECENKTSRLAWQIRTRIIAEISLALIFLHSNTHNMIIHGDLKPDNILLDAKFVSKLGDFGISRLIRPPDSGITACYETYHPIGTPGYIDPEFVCNGMLTEKSDVYSFGIIILRLLTRKPAMCIAIHVEDAIENGTFHEILDASAGEWPLDQAEELAKLALRCAKIERRARPNLFEIWPIIERLRRNL